MILKFEQDIPQLVKLKYPTGKHELNQFDKEQVRYSLVGGNLMYVPLIVEKQLQELNVKPGQPVEIMKADESGKTRWKVRRPDAKPANGHPQPAATLIESAILEGIEAQDPAPAIPSTRLAEALKTALAAAKVAEAYSLEIGHPVQFDKDDVRLMAQTLVINSYKERAA